MLIPKQLPRLLPWLRWYPPFLGAGIRVTHFTRDLRAIDVEMRLQRWNANYVGTHFGGSLYTMTDPFYMLMLIHNLGKEYVVWDKAATIRFRKPGRGTVRAQFRLSQAELDLVREQLRTSRKVEPTFQVKVESLTGEIVAEVEKVLHVRRRAPQAPAN